MMKITRSRQNSNPRKSEGKRIEEARAETRASLERNRFPSIPGQDIDPLWRADEVAARDGGSWRDEIYGFGQFRGAKWKRRL